MTIFKEVRLKYGYTQQKMADVLGIKIRTYRSYELGEVTAPYKIISSVLKLRKNEEDLKLAGILDELIELKLF